MKLSKILWLDVINKLLTPNFIYANISIQTYVCQSWSENKLELNSDKTKMMLVRKVLDGTQP